MCKTNFIYSGDCIEIMRKEIGKNSIPLIFADPPYNLSGKSLNLENNQTGGAYYKVNEEWDTFNYSDYVDFTKKWLTEAHNILTSNGSLYISCTQHNIGEILFLAKECFQRNFPTVHRPAVHCRLLPEQECRMRCLK